MTSSTNNSSNGSSTSNTSTTTSGVSASGSSVTSGSAVTSAAVGAIFREAGAAFQQLGELTQSLQIQNETTSASSKWSETELAFFRSSIRRFSSDLLTLTSHMRNKTKQQMKISLKRKAYEEVGIPAGKSSRFAIETVKLNPDERLPPLVYERDEMKTEPTSADVPSPISDSPRIKCSHDQELSSEPVKDEEKDKGLDTKKDKGQDKDVDDEDTLEEGELEDDDVSKDNDAFLVT